MSLLVLAACGEESPAPLDTPDFDPIPASLPPTPAGVTLAGDPERPALDAVVDMPQSPAPGSDRDGLYLTSRLEAWLAPDVTIGDVNTALDEHEARVLSMIEGLPLVTLVIAPVADAEALTARAASIQESSAFLMVLPAMTAEAPLSVGRAAGGPSQERVAPGTETVPNHLEAARSPAAWNVRAAALSAGATVPVLVADFFSALTPHPEISAMSFPAGVTGQPSASENHGWHVTGTIASDFGGNDAVGIHSDASTLLDVQAIPMGGLSWSGMMQEILARMPDAGPFVVSTSLGWGIDPAVHGTNGGNWTAQQLMTGIQQGIIWRLAVADRADRFIHATAAGNERTYAGTMQRADLVSPWTMSASFDDLRDALPAGLLSTAEQQAIDFLWAAVAAGDPGASSRLENTIIVGSSDAFGTESWFSNSGPTLRATGDSVFNVCRVAGGGCDGTYERKSGTSMATPQIAGMAAWLWNLRPEWTSTQMRERLVEAYAGGLTDHYAATLATDGGVSDAPVRRAILDVAGSAPSPGSNGRFDESDIELFLEFFESYEILRQTESGTDHSRYDLNGDGYTDVGSASSLAPVDLDFDRLTIGTVSYVAGGQTQSVEEGFPTDLEVLCYYAYSTLYEGDIEARDESLVDCIGERPPLTLDSLTVFRSGSHVIASASAIDFATSDEWVRDVCEEPIEPAVLDPSAPHQLSLNCSASASRGRAAGSSSMNAGFVVTPTYGADGALTTIGWSGNATARAQTTPTVDEGGVADAGAEADVNVPIRAVVTADAPIVVSLAGNVMTSIVRIEISGRSGTLLNYDSRREGDAISYQFNLPAGTYSVELDFIQTIRASEIVVGEESASGSFALTMTFAAGSG